MSYSVRFGDNYSKLRGREYYKGEVLPNEDDMAFLADELERLRGFDCCCCCGGNGIVLGCGKYSRQGLL